MKPEDGFPRSIDNYQSPEVYSCFLLLRNIFVTSRHVALYAFTTQVFKSPEPLDPLVKMLCPLSALNPSGGPERLIDTEDLEPLSTEIASEIASYGDVSLSPQDVTDIVRDALRLTLPPQDSPDNYDLAPRLPDGISDWIHYEPIGIGHFGNENGECPADEQGRFPTGRDVEVRHLAEYDGYGYFYGVIEEEDGDDITVSKRSCCRPWTDASIFVMHGNLEYLRAWLDPALPPRVAFADSAPSMSLEGELYEIINSRQENRLGTGLLPEISYGDITQTLEIDQFRFLKARKGSRHLSSAINKGLREAELLPALMADFQCWQSMRPDIWPSPESEGSSQASPFTHYPTSLENGNPFKTLPAELLLEILRQLPIKTVLTLSSASRSLRGLITEPAFINQIVKTAVLFGSEYWVLPVDNLPGERQPAWVEASKWLRPPNSIVLADYAPITDCEPIADSPFLSATFPFLPFLRACYASDSMRNRQRLWNIVKQFDDLWRDYRLNGWQKKDIFIID